MAIDGNLLSVTTSSIEPNGSGWAAKLNCTLLLGSGGRVGAAVLAVKSVAAGEMQARAFSSVPVTAGELYWTFADASASTQAERIGIRWLDVAGTEISVTWSPTTATASASWHRVSVAGYAPVGTVRAQVLLSATVSGALVLHYWENVYLGLPMRYTGNLLSFNAEAGGEVDVSGWAAEAGCTVSRIAPVSIWAADFYGAGGCQIALTTTGAGNASALCTEQPPITPGVEYVALSYLGPPTSGSSVWVELRFYDATGTQLSAHRSTLAPPGTGLYRQLTSAVAPSNAASASVAVGITGASAGQVTRIEGVFVGPITASRSPSLRTGNVLPMADWDFEMGIGAWTVASGAATLARSTPWGAQHFYDYYSLTVTSATATTSVIRSGIYPVGDAAGQNWRHEIYTKVAAGGWNMTLGIRWFDASDTLISTTASVADPVDTPDWWSRWTDQTAPAGAVKAQLEVTLAATSTSSILQIDRPALWQTVATATVEAFPESASTQLVLRELEPGTLLTVWRVTPDGIRRHVRGPDGLYDGTTVVDTDSLIVEDYEAPLGVPVYYRIETVWPDGTGRSYRTTSEVTLDPGDRNYTWLTDPGRPGIGLRVLVKSAPEWKQAIEQTAFQVRGRATPVILSDSRGSRTGDLLCWTETDEQRETLRFLLSTGNVLLWRCPPGSGETDVYVAVAETQFPRVVPLATEPWREWTLPMTEVDMPTGGQAGSAHWTVYDVVLEYATGYDVLDRYATVFDLAIDRRM